MSTPGTLSRDPTTILLFDSRKGQQDGREHERVLACYPYDLDINEQTVLTGLAQAHAAFITENAESTSPVTVITMKERTWVIEQIEPSIFLVLIVNRTLWGQRDGPKDNVLREFASLASVLLHGLVGLVQTILYADPSGKEVRLTASPILGAVVQAFEDVDGPLGRAFLATPLAECSYPRVLPWGERTKNLCQLLRQELISWSGSRLRRRVLDDGSTRIHGGELSAQVAILYTVDASSNHGRKRWPSLRSGGPSSKRALHSSTYLVESSLGPRDTQLLYWIGAQALANEEELKAIPEDAERQPVAYASDVTRSVFEDTPPPSARGSARNFGTATPSGPSSSSWLMSTLAKALPSWANKPRAAAVDRRFSVDHGSSGLAPGFLLRGAGQARDPSASDSPLSISSLWDWGSTSSPRNRGGSTGTAATTNYSPNSPFEAQLALATSRIGTFLSSAPDLPYVNPAMLGRFGEGSYRGSSGYAYEGSYRNSRVGLGFSVGAELTSPTGTNINTASPSQAVSSGFNPRSSDYGVLTGEGSYRGGDFTWANCYASVAISAHLRRQIKDEDPFEHPIIAAQIRSNAVHVGNGAQFSSDSPAALRSSAHGSQSSKASDQRRRRTTTPLEARHWKPVVCDVEVPSSVSQSGQGAPAASRMLQLVSHFPQHETFRNQFGGRICTVHLQGPSGHCALVPVRTGPLLFLVAIPLKRLDQSVEAMLTGGSSGAPSASRTLDYDAPPVPEAACSPSNPRYRRFAQERALEVVAGICGDVLLKVADQLGPAAAKDALEMQEGDLRGIRYLARNCELRQCMATPERKALQMSVEASETLEKLRACLYEGGLPSLDEAPPPPLVNVSTSPNVARTAGLTASPRDRDASLPFHGKGKVIEPGSWSALSLTFSRSIGIVLAGDPDSADPVPSGSRPTSSVGALLASSSNSEGLLRLAAGGREGSTLSRTRSSLSMRAGPELPNGVREVIVKAADGTWVCALEKFVDSDDSTRPESDQDASAVRMGSGDALHAGRKIQLFVIASRRETKDAARTQLYTLANKLDL